MMFTGLEAYLFSVYTHDIKPVAYAFDYSVLFALQDALVPVWKLHEQKHVPLRTAAFVYALENVIKVAKARGYGG